MRGALERVEEPARQHFFLFLTRMSDSGKKPDQDSSIVPSSSYGSIPVANDNSSRTETPWVLTDKQTEIE